MIMFARLRECFQSEKPVPTEQERKYAQFRVIVARIEKNESDLVEVDFSETPLSTELLLQFCQALKKNHHVKKLNISNSEVTVEVARLLAQSEITTLIASHCNINDDVMTEIAKSSYLEYLDISVNYLMDRGVEALASNRNITRLVLDFNSPNLEGAVTKLSAMQQLICLSLAASGVKDDHLSSLMLLCSLQTLCLGGSYIYSEALKEALKKSHSLKTLSLPCTPVRQSQQQDMIESFPKITFLFQRSSLHLVAPQMVNGAIAKL